MNGARETYFAALFAAVSKVANFNTKGRRLILPRNMDDVAKPAIFQIEDDEEYGYSGVLQKVTLKVDLWIYTASGLDPTKTPSQELNAILDALDAALKPVTQQDLLTQRFTLGGLVQWARIEGRVFKDPGDLTGLGLAIVPMSILVP